MKILRSRSFIFSLLVFSALNLSLYLFIFFLHQSDGLLKSLSVFDANWYLQIAKTGYVSRMSYAFFPLYPLAMRLTSLITGDIGVAAAVSTVFLLLANFTSLYYVLAKLLSSNIAAKTSLLFWTLPFGIVFRSFYAENLFLFFLIWFGFFLLRKRFFLAALFLGLASVTKGNGLPMIILLVFSVRGSLWKRITVGLFTLIPMAIWSGFCAVRADSPIYFLVARNAWAPFFVPFLTLIVSILTQPLEAIPALIYSLLLFTSRKTIPTPLWWISVVLFFVPILTFTSPFSRTQITSFPLFIYPALRLSGKLFWGVVLLELVGLFVLSIYFVNWSWGA